MIDCATPTKILKQSFTFAGSGEMAVRGDLRFVTGAQAKLPIVIFCHGFKGFKDWGGFPELADYFAQRGLAFISFNFSHGGIGEDPMQLTELGLFKANTYARELEDLKLLVNHLRSGQLANGERLDTEHIFLVGHSRGGVAALCAAAEISGVAGVVTLASISRLGRIDAELEARWRAAGEFLVINARTKQQLPLGLPLLEEILAEPNRIEAAVRALRVPLLVIHGDQDAAVSVLAAHDLKSWFPSATLEILPGADHTFGVKHPFLGTTPEFEQIKSRMLEFFSEH